MWKMRREERMKCGVCGSKLKKLTEDYLYCTNPKCPTIDKGWERAILKGSQQKEAKEK